MKNYLRCYTCNMSASKDVTTPVLKKIYKNFHYTGGMATYRGAGTWSSREKLFYHTCIGLSFGGGVV